MLITFSGRYSNLLETGSRHPNRLNLSLNTMSYHRQAENEKLYYRRRKKNTSDSDTIPQICKPRRLTTSNGLIPLILARKQPALTNAATIRSYTRLCSSFSLVSIYAIDQSALEIHKFVSILLLRKLGKARLPYLDWFSVCIENIRWHVISFTFKYFFPRQHGRN